MTNLENLIRSFCISPGLTNDTIKDLALAISKECFKDTFTLAQIEEAAKYLKGKLKGIKKNSRLRYWYEMALEDLIARLKEGE